MGDAQGTLVAMHLALRESELPVRLRFDRPMSDDELMRFCVANEALRVEREANGEILVRTPTGSEGGSMELEVGSELRQWARGDGRGKAFGPSSGFTLPDSSVRAADAAWVSWERWNALTRTQQRGYAPLCPEFVIELRSESDGLSELAAKMEMWIANGAQLAWLIDPERKVVAIYRPGQAVEVLEQPEMVPGDGPVAGFELGMARIWQ
jgi:Uma2 family endonuclease